MNMTGKTKEPRQTDDVVQVVCIVRRESKAGLLITMADIAHRLAGSNEHIPLVTELEILLKKTIDENEDIRELVAGNGFRYYFSMRFMTEAYASILLKKQGDSLRLIADIVRQNTADYLRPVPLDMFMQSPFNFTYDEILEMVERMEDIKEFHDIRRTATSSFREFLYSADIMESMHASMLAQWFDVGQLENP